MIDAKHRFDNAKRRRPEHHARQAMLTPSYVLEPIRALLGGIDLDPCTEPDNPTAAKAFYSLPQDGAALPWSGSVFCNPPYGEVRGRWVERCIAHDGPAVLLIPAHTETQLFQRALSACETLLLVKARLRFGVLRENGRQEAASHGSAIFGFRCDLSPLNSLGFIARSANGARIPSVQSLTLDEINAAWQQTVTSPDRSATADVRFASLIQRALAAKNGWRLDEHAPR